MEGVRTRKSRNGAGVSLRKSKRQMPSSLFGNPKTIVSNFDSSCRRVQIQFHCFWHRLRLLLWSRTKIRIRMLTAIVRIGLLTISSLRWCHCQGRNKQKRVVSVWVRVIAVSNRASNVQIASACFVVAYLACIAS